MRVVLLLLLAVLAARPSAAAETYGMPGVGGSLEAAHAPPLDLGDLRRRIVPTAAPSVPDLPPGQMWVHDVVNRVYGRVAVEVGYESEHALWYVERGRDPGDLAAAARYFEARTFPTILRLVAPGWEPGRDGRPKIGIFNGHLAGVAGYMSLGDLQPRSVFSYSNERPMVYLSTDGARAGSGAYNGTLAHETEHLAHAQVNPSQQGWIDEGLAELVSRLVTESDQPQLGAFRAQPDVQLNGWGAHPWEARPHYEASYLWGRYLLQRAGGPDALPDLVAAGGAGFETVAHFAAARRLGPTADLFRDWLVANVIGEPTRDGRYGYPGLDFRAATVGTLRAGADPVDGSVNQFAADYYELETSGPGDLVVATSPAAPLLGASDNRGGFYWSIRGDNLDTRLTRRFDLSGVGSASLSYRVWYDLEPEYDLCYVLASRDGTSWLPLAGTSTHEVANAGLALGPAYTGRSPDAPAWSDERVDLGQFAGGPVWLRFECVSDQNIGGAGFAVDDLEVPEIGFADDAEVDRGWQTEGFVRTADSVGEPALVAVADVFSDRVAVREVPLDASGAGRLRLDGSLGTPERRVAILAGRAPGTLLEMPYRLWLESTAP